MKIASEVKFSDIVSEKTPASAAVEQINSQSSGERKRIFTEYEPKADVINQIDEFIKNNDELIKVVVFGAVWCPDCVINGSQFMKIWKTINDINPNFDVYEIMGIKVKPPAQRKQATYIWAVPPSPVETNDSKFDIRKIPTFFIFNKNGDCIGKIEESAKLKPTLEEELLEYLTR